MLGAALSLSAVPVAGRGDPLPSWNQGETRKAITDFVARVTTPGSPDFVRPPERIAVFDNDGTLWSEQPVYFQVAFAFDRIRMMAPEHPAWKTTERPPPDHGLRQFRWRPSDAAVDYDGIRPTLRRDHPPHR